MCLPLAPTPCYALAPYLSPIMRAAADAVSAASRGELWLVAGCLVCQKGLTGQAGAMEHAKETGHGNFAEYR